MKKTVFFEKRKLFTNAKDDFGEKLAYNYPIQWKFAVESIRIQMGLPEFSRIPPYVSMYCRTLLHYEERVEYENSALSATFHKLYKVIWRSFKPF